ncbi:MULTISPECIES: hypothetical protein [unclassified Streptomyces]|uniref:hypothetical protein n=1 Tax=unclassified Streptomyces TaxID=2593676 RepID=UPI002DDC5FC5|nr:MULTISPECIES: hypothetical protein [unclassified Streptomyces]WSB75444.1 hypothetical protein OHB04_06390 [Streptomyces sp. NBC_01775]WSS16271.1 hypothetical protein OG533_33505 [Streptomyces sp. NBC_01186]WSS45088.1 hypothetical protein OG220_34180 [Streptomyces sp. NBC_01187]
MGEQGSDGRPADRGMDYARAEPGRRTGGEQHLGGSGALSRAASVAGIVFASLERTTGAPLAWTAD